MNRLRNFLAAYRLYRRWSPLRVAIKAAWRAVR